MTNLFIFNTDFRLKDNPALFHAAENGDSLVALFIHNPKKWQRHNESDLKIAFQIEHLKRLSKKLSELNISLKIIQAEEIDKEIEARWNQLTLSKQEEYNSGAQSNNMTNYNPYDFESYRNPVSNNSISYLDSSPSTISQSAECPPGQIKNSENN